MPMGSECVNRANDLREETKPRPHKSVCEKQNTLKNIYRCGFQTCSFSYEVNDIKYSCIFQECILRKKAQNASKKSLNIHARKVHNCSSISSSDTSLKIFQCDKFGCESIYRYKKDLQDHKDRIHKEGKFIYSCKSDGRSFYSKLQALKYINSKNMKKEAADKSKEVLVKICKSCGLESSYDSKRECSNCDNEFNNNFLSEQMMKAKSQLMNTGDTSVQFVSQTKISRKKQNIIENVHLAKINAQKLIPQNVYFQKINAENINSKKVNIEYDHFGKINPLISEVKDLDEIQEIHNVFQPLDEQPNLQTTNKQEKASIHSFTKSDNIDRRFQGPNPSVIVKTNNHVPKVSTESILRRSTVIVTNPASSNIVRPDQIIAYNKDSPLKKPQAVTNVLFKEAKKSLDAIGIKSATENILPKKPFDVDNEVTDVSMPKKCTYVPLELERRCYLNHQLSPISSDNFVKINFQETLLFDFPNEPVEENGISTERQNQLENTSIDSCHINDLAMENWLNMILDLDGNLEHVSPSSSDDFVEVTCKDINTFDFSDELVGDKQKCQNEPDNSGDFFTFTSETTSPTENEPVDCNISPTNTAPVYSSTCDHFQYSPYKKKMPYINDKTCETLVENKTKQKQRNNDKICSNTHMENRKRSSTGSNTDSVNKYGSMPQFPKLQKL